MPNLLTRHHNILMLDINVFLTELAIIAEGALLQDVNHRIQCFNKTVHFRFCVVNIRRGSGGRADAQSMMQRLRAVVPRSHSNACTSHNMPVSIRPIQLSLLSYLVHIAGPKHRHAAAVRYPDICT